MKQKLAALGLAAALCLSLAACKSTTTTQQATVTAAETAATTSQEMFTDRDYEVGYSDYVTVTLSDSGSTADGEGVTVSGSTVTINKAGTYLLTGSLSDGQVVVSVADTDKVQIVLDNASITSSTTAALSVEQADKVFLTMAENSNNTLCSTAVFDAAASNVDAAVFAKSDLTMNGNGTLTIRCTNGHGVVSKDDLKVTSGTYQITAGASGLSGKDSVRIADGTFTLNTDTDGIHAENADDATKGFVYVQGGTFTVTAGTDGIDASSTVEIEGGTFTLTTGGGSANASTKTDSGWGQWGPQQTTTATTATDTETASAKGVKATTAITINGGTLTIDSSDDSIHTNGDLTVSNGTINASSGDDGMHADSSLTISGGTVTIAKSYEGLEAEAITISGGTTAVTASDDGVNAAGGSDSSSVSGRAGQNTFATDTAAMITISGGKLTVDAQGDGLDSNGSMQVSGGETYVTGPSNSGNGALDYNGTATITGGVLVAAGSTGMDQNFGSSSTQGSILVDLSSVQSSGTVITLTDSSGNVLASYLPTRQFQSVVVSAPGVTTGQTYTLTVGSESQSITMTDFIYGSGSEMGGGMGGQGGMQGGAPGNRGSRPDQNTSGTDGTTGATTPPSTGSTAGNT